MAPRSLRRALAAVALAGFVLAGATPALADEYDAHRAGHPLRIVAYLVHPIGVALDWLIFRPAHWVAHEPFVAHVFGHDPDEDPQR